MVGVCTGEGRRVCGNSSEGCAHQVVKVGRVSFAPGPSWRQ